MRSRPTSASSRWTPAAATAAGWRTLAAIGLAVLAGCRGPGNGPVPTSVTGQVPTSVTGGERDDVRPRPAFALEVVVAVPGAPPVAIEAATLRPLESALLGLAGLESLDAVARDGVAHLRLRVVGDEEKALAAVRTALDSAKRALPAESEAPIVRRAPSAVPTWFSLTADDRPVEDLRAMYDEHLSRGIRAARGVTEVEVCGGGAIVRAQLDSTRLAASGLTPSDVARALREAGRAASLDDLGHTRLREGLTLRDVAVTQLASAPDCWCLRDGDPAVCVEVRGVQGAVLDAPGARELPASIRWRRVSGTGLRLHVAGPAAEARRLMVAAADRLAATSGVRGSLLRARAHGDAIEAVVDAAEAGAVEAALRGLPDLSVTPVEEPTLVVRIAGDDLAGLATLAGRVAALVAAEAAVRSWEIRGVATRPTIEFEVDRQRAAELGVAASEVAEALSAAQVGLSAGVVLAGGRPTEVRVFTGSIDDDPGAHAQVRVRASGGTLVPIAAVARIVQSEAPVAILRRNGRRVVEVAAWTRDPPPGWTAALRGKLATSVELPAGHSLEVQGP